MKHWLQTIFNFPILQQQIIKTNLLRTGRLSLVLSVADKQTYRQKERQRQTDRCTVVESYPVFYKK